MALHGKHDIRGRSDDRVYASADPTQTLPRYRIPDDEADPRLAASVVRDELMLNGNARQNLATFCQTWLDRETHELMDACIGKNLIDKDESPQTAEIEARCVHMLADLWNAPAAADTLGTSTVGSSDAAMLGGMAAKWRWREKRRAEGIPWPQRRHSRSLALPRARPRA